MGNQYDICIFIQDTQLRQTSHDNITNCSVIQNVFNRTQFLIFNVTIVLRLQRVLAGNISCGTSHMEGSQCQLSTRLTDRLCSDNPDSLTFLNHTAGCQVTSITFRTYPLLRLASQYGTYFNPLDRRFLDNISNHLRDFITGSHD